jgi:hypothetical protein
MSAPNVGKLSSRRDAEVKEARGWVGAFQSHAEATRQGVRDRSQGFLPIAERITAMAREKLERLKARLKFGVTPGHSQTEKFSLTSVTLEVKSELAGAIRLGFRLTHDSDVGHILLDYELEIIPVPFQFDPHARLEIPRESYDEAAVGKWLDDRIVEFANAYVELLSTKHDQDRAMVLDAVAVVGFPKHFEAAALEQDGTACHYTSEETRREFAERHGMAR